MHSLSVGRIPHGLLLISLLWIGSGFAETEPAALAISPSSNRSCTARPSKFPSINLDCAHRLQFLGRFSAEGTFRPLSRLRRWHNQDAVVPDNFERSGIAIARPVEVPAFVNMHPQERDVANYAPPAHAVSVLQAQTKLGGWRDHIITFAYGREQPVLTPQQLAVDSHGRLIVSDPESPAVHVIDGKNSFRISAGERRRLRKPGGVAVDADDNIYIVDSDQGLVDVYDARGNFLRFIGKVDDETLFDRPSGIAIDRIHGRIYLADTPRNVVLILDIQGHILKRIGRRTASDVAFEFNYPTEITMNGDELVVLDSSGSRMQVFDLEGNLVRRFSTYTAGPPTGPKMSSQMGLGADEEGNIYLSNLPGARIRVFTREGRILNSFGRIGSRADEFNRPAGIAVHGDKLYVSDMVTRQISVFRIESVSSTLTQTLVAARN